jgi:hypothetical protein
MKQQDYAVTFGHQQPSPLIDFLAKNLSLFRYMYVSRSVIYEYVIPRLHISFDSEYNIKPHEYLPSPL